MLAAFEAGVAERREPRVLLSKALPIAEGIVEALRAQAESAGWSWRARRAGSPTASRTST